MPATRKARKVKKGKKTARKAKPLAGRREARLKRKSTRKAAPKRGKHVGMRREAPLKPKRTKPLIGRRERSFEPGLVEPEPQTTEPEFEASKGFEGRKDSPLKPT